MNKIGNIISDVNVNNIELYNKVSCLSEIDNNLPTLIIGLDKARENINGFSILKKRYNNIFWTFKKNERRNDYENDTKLFFNYSINCIIKDIKYKYINFTKFKSCKIKSFINYINLDKKIYYIMPNNNFIFIYDKNIKTVMGISLSLCDYAKLKRDKIIKKINNSNNLCKIDNKFIYNEMVKPFIFDKPHYILPLYEYLLS